MTTKVAIVPIQGDYSSALRQAIELAGGIADINTPARKVTIKVGIFDPKQYHHACIDTVRAITEAFDQAPHISVAESDNYCGKALDRLERFNVVYSPRVTPHSLSEDPQATLFNTIAGGEMALSPVLFKPRVLVSTHVLRNFIKGSVLKNLFGCTPTVQKGKYHKNEIFYNQLCDLFQAFGGIDLAVLDGTYLHHGASGKKLAMDILIVGRDAVAVETVGAVLAGLKPEKVPTIQAFAGRGLGETDMNQIEIVGVTPDEFARLKKKYRELKKMIETEPRKPGLSGTIDLLVEEGWLDAGRSAQDVADELQSRGIGNATKAMTDATLKRRLRKTLERAKDDAGTWIYRRKQAS